MFFNKVDLLKQKIKTSHLNDYFAKYEGPNEYEPAITFLANRFEKIVTGEHRSVFVHRTCAVDTQQMKNVLKDICRIIFEKAFSKSTFA